MKLTDKEKKLVEAYTKKLVESRNSFSTNLKDDTKVINKITKEFIKELKGFISMNKDNSEGSMSLTIDYFMSENGNSGEYETSYGFN